MKKYMLIAFTLFSAASFARVCQVDLVDATSRYRYETFRAYTYDRNCRDGLRDCNREKMRRNLRGARCVVRDHRAPVPAPDGRGRYGNPVPNYNNPFQVCQKAAFEYKTTFDFYMNVNEWCSDVRTMREAQCRAENLMRKGRTGYPRNVKAYCY